MAVSCGVDNMVWGAETMGSLVGEWLEEVNMVSSWTNMKLGDLVSATVSKLTDFGVLLDVSGVQGLVTNSNLGGNAVCEGDTVAGVVVFIDNVARVVELSCEGGLVSLVTTKKAGRVAKVGTVVKGKIVVHKTEHSISVAVISCPVHLSGMVGFLGTRRHVNDLAGQEFGEEGQEVTMIIHEVTKRGELVVVLEREIRKAGGKGIKRSRSHSVSEEPKREKQKKKKNNSVSEDTPEEIAKPDIDMPEVVPKENVSLSVSEECKNEKRKKKKKSLSETPSDVVTITDNLMEVEQTDVLSVVTDLNENVEKKKTKKKKKKDK